MEPNYSLRNWFLVGTPLQLLNAYEALHHFGCDPNESVVIVLDNHTELNSQHLHSLANQQAWPHMLILPERRQERLRRLLLARSSAWKRGMLRLGEQLLWRSLGIPLEQLVLGVCCFRQLDRLCRRHPGLDNLFVGYYGSPIMRHVANTVKATRVVLLEEGANQLHLYADLHSSRPRFARQYYLDPVANRIKKLLLGVNLKPIEAVHFFTAYDLPATEKVRVTRHRYERFKQLIRPESASSSSNDEVFFLGEWLTAWDCCSDGQYEEFLRQARHELGNRRMVFIPHRRTPQSTEQRIRKIPGFELRRLDGPVELALASMDPRPDTIAAFFSSALFNLSMLFGSAMNLHAFQLPLNYPTPAIEHYIEDFYGFARRYFPLAVHVREITRSS